MPVIPVVRDVQPDFVQARRPFQHQLRKRIVQLPRLPNLPEEIQHRRLDALCLQLADYRFARKSRPLGWLFARRSAPPLPRGLYVWGSVGRGKTMLMDRFFSTVPIGLDASTSKISCRMFKPGFIAYANRTQAMTRSRQWLTKSRKQLSSFASTRCRSAILPMR